MRHPPAPPTARECGVPCGRRVLRVAQVGLSRAQRLCQCKTVSITALEPLPMQVDGEPWMQTPALLQVGGLRGCLGKRP